MLTIETSPQGVPPGGRNNRVGGPVRSNNSAWNPVFWRRLLAIICLIAVFGCRGGHGGRLIRRDPCDGSPCQCERCRMAARRGGHPLEPYRPFDDHFPRFHPVPTQPVFPSLANFHAAEGAKLAPVPASDSPKRGASPETEKTPPAPLPEVLSTPPSRPEWKPMPGSPGARTTPSGSSSTEKSWVFRPATVAEPNHGSRGESSSDEVSESPRLLR